MTSLVDDLRTAALSAGAVGFGVTTAAPFEDTRDELHRRTESGQRGDLTFTYGDPDTATDVKRSFPWATHLVVVAVPYLPEAGSPGSPGGSVRVARFATSDHYTTVRGALDAIDSRLRAGGYRTAQLTDDNRLVDRAAAVRAGVGWWGKSTLVLVPGAGPWVLLGSVVTDADLDESEPMTRTCGTCVACIEACPTGAIVAPGVLDARLCIAHWSQVAGIVPRAMRSAMGDRLYGCDECLDACPPGFRLLERASRRSGRHAIAEVLGAPDDELAARFGHFYVPKRRMSLLRRNALIAAGNVGDESLFDAVVGYTGHPDPVLRVHAVWALIAMDPPRARVVLQVVAATERDDDVLEEVRHHLGVDGPDVAPSDG
jgi:epoxyqueuosine reductase